MHLAPQFRNPLISSIAFLRSFLPLGLPAAALALLFFYSSPSFAQQGSEKTFASPGEAVLALYNASKAGDTQTRDAIFGSNSKNYFIPVTMLPITTVFRTSSAATKRCIA